jgi:hypothetical protein
VPPMPGLMPGDAGTLGGAATNNDAVAEDPNLLQLITRCEDARLIAFGIPRSPIRFWAAFVDIGIGNVPGLLVHHAEIRNCRSEWIRGIDRFHVSAKEAPP